MCSFWFGLCKISKNAFSKNTSPVASIDMRHATKSILILMHCDNRLLEKKRGSSSTPLPVCGCSPPRLLLLPPWFNRGKGLGRPLPRTLGSRQTHSHACYWHQLLCSRPHEADESLGGDSAASRKRAGVIILKLRCSVMLCTRNYQFIRYTCAI